MKVGDLVRRNPDAWCEDNVMGIIISIESEDNIRVAWYYGYSNVYSVYDLEVVS